MSLKNPVATLKTQSLHLFCMLKFYLSAMSQLTLNKKRNCELVRAALFRTEIKRENSTSGLFRFSLQLDDTSVRKSEPLFYKLCLIRKTCYCFFPPRIKMREHYVFLCVYLSYFILSFYIAFYIVVIVTE